MKGLLLKDLYIAKSNILVTIVCLIVLGFGLSFLLEASALLVLAPPCATTAVNISRYEGHRYAFEIHQYT